MGPGHDIQKIQALVVIIIGCSLMAGTVSAEYYTQIFTGACCGTGCCNNSFFLQNPSICPFGNTYGGGDLAINVISAGSTHFSATPISGTLPLTVQFSANSASDITTWHWDFGDGTYGSGTNPVHIYTTAGNYTVKLTVRTEITSDNYPASVYYTWDHESTWQKEDMIHVYEPVNTNNQATLDPLAQITSVNGGAISMTNGVHPENTIMGVSGVYQPSINQKPKTIYFQRAKPAYITSGLTTWRN